ncbi:MAG: manganese efflux pump MntP family protein [Endomicrobia bacterium]|nr:manganese efflux pump MntP family protein [Endomicrobiia bacterium]
MSFIELLLLAAALSMDAFAVAVSIGLASAKTTVKKALITGLYFGIFQAVMPLIGYALAAQFADKITAYDHWIAFGLLVIIGAKMIFESFEKDKKFDACENVLAPAKMLPLAVATSIDALAVGISFAFLQVSIIPAVALIGFITFAISAIGVKIGALFGTRFKSKAELAGGVILILIGLKILLQG